MNKIISGVNTLEAGLAGQSICSVRAMLEQALNIDPTAQPAVGGEILGEDYVLANGDELEFVKPSGTKG
ncbi:MAG: hypothetical protein KBD19_03170 [Candidatus Moranbacteria bacterium]|nr:hypothetical protein [Candidatus Moranbacteria bacterium]